MPPHTLFHHYVLGSPSMLSDFLHLIRAVLQFSPRWCGVVVPAPVLVLVWVLVLVLVCWCWCWCGCGCGCGVVFANLLVHAVMASFVQCSQ